MITSVIMATCDGSRHLGEQLATLVSQSRLPDELIISDDASTDTTLQILHAFQASAPFPVYIHRNEERVGYSRNFSNLAQLAAGDVILFCDQDDHWMDRKIELVTEWFEANPQKVLATHNISICDEQLNVCIDDYFKHLDRNHARHVFLKGCATAIRRELADTAFPFPTPSNWHHDNRVHAIARANGTFGYIDQVLIKHRMHVSQSSGFVVSSKALGGRMLAALDERAIKSSPAWSRGLRLLPRPHTESTLREFLETIGKENQAPLVAPAFIRMQRREALATMQEGTKFSCATRLLHFFLAGGYESIGGGWQYVADSIRVAKT